MAATIAIIVLWKTNVKNRKFLILSIDGGGIRGILPISLLKRIKNELNFDILSNFSMFCGTSTGGIISLMLANGENIEKIEEFYMEKRKKVFKKRFFTNFFISKYSPKGLEKELRNVFKNKRINELSDDIEVLIPAFDLEAEGEWKPKFFTKDDCYLLFEIAMATSAAPTYFPPYKGYIDGGVVCNNPSLAAICFALSKGYSLDEIYLLSLGTGDVKTFSSYMDNNIGVIQWSNKLIKIMFDGLNDVVDTQCEELLGDNYLRLNPILPGNSPWPLDDINSVYPLINIAKNYKLDKIEKWIERVSY